MENADRPNAAHLLVLMCLYISLSDGRFLIKCHLLIRMFLKLGRAGWYVVTKGRFFSALSFFVEVPSFHLTANVILYSFY